MSQRVRLAGNGGSPIFRVSKPGADITSGNLDDFMIHEAFFNAIPEVIIHVSTMSSIGSNLWQFTYAHGLPYTPLVLPLSSLYEMTCAVDSVGYYSHTSVSNDPNTWCGSDSNYAYLRADFALVPPGSVSHPAGVDITLCLYAIPVQ